MILLAWLHVVSAVVWIGGMVFLSLILVPVFRRGTFGADRRILFQTLARRFRVVVWISIAALVLTGPFLIAARSGSLDQADAWGSVLRIKLGLVAGLVIVTALHDFWLGPLVGRLRREGSETSPADQFLIRMSVVIARLGLLLALAILFFAVTLARM
ncbi:DUF4149 domain-containing protein [Candidatus Nitrospira bockiana]